MDTVQHRVRGSAADDWVVTEKIHGANFGIYYRDGELKVASRNQFVDGGFFNNKAWVDAHEGELQTLFETVADERYVGRGEIVAFGELFGRGINKGVEYPDGRHFMLFDVLVIEEFGLRYFLNWHNVEHYADVAELKTVPVLARGTLSECMNFDSEFKSVAGEIIDPTFTSGDDNLAEGVVIRPVHTFYVGHDRAMLKVKIDKFKETISAPKEPKPDASKILLDYPGLLTMLRTQDWTACFRKRVT